MKKAKYLKVIGGCEVVFLIAGVILYIVYWCKHILPFGDVEAAITLATILLFGPLVAVLLFSLAELLERSIKQSEQLDALIKSSVSGKPRTSDLRSGDTVSVISKCDDVDGLFMFEAGNVLIVGTPLSDYVLCTTIDNNGMKHIVKMRYENIKKMS